MRVQRYSFYATLPIYSSNFLLTGSVIDMDPDVMVTHASEVDRNVLSAFLSRTCKRTCAVQLIAVERNNLPAEHGNSNQYSKKA